MGELAPTTFQTLGMIDEKEAAKLVNRSHRTIARWRREEGFPFHRRGKLILIDIAEMRAWLRGEEPKPAPRRRRRRQAEGASA